MRSIYARQEDVERTHRAATIDFLDYVQKLGTSTESFLQGLVSEPPDPDLTDANRQSLALLRGFWRDLHGFVKPARDADTLHSPVALIEQLEIRLSAIPHLEGCRLLICHTPEMNYVQYPRSSRQVDADYYADIVPGAYRFPRKLAIIAIPYSQDESVFSNIIICHEIGHFVFEELKLQDDLSPYIEASLQQHFPDTDSETDLSWCRDRLWSWSEEIYCDRFAIGLIGPAYSFSYMELFDVIGEGTDGSTEFYDTHPSTACRFQQHAEQLRSADWWPLLDRDGRSYAEAIRGLEAVPSNQYMYRSEEKPHLTDKVLDAFRDVLPNIADLVRKTFDGREVRFDQATLFPCVDLIQHYLSWGVVPSTLVSNKAEYVPDPALLINAAYLFYLEELHKLIERIRSGTGEETDTAVALRAKWGQRVEQWTMKALEDLRFPTGAKIWGS
jgi:hypothetical protein